MKYVHAACNVVATLALCVLVWRLIKLTAVIQTQVPIVVASLQAIQTDTTRTEAEMAGVLNATRKAVLTPQQIKSLVDKSSLVLDNTNKSIVHLDDVITEITAVVPTVNQSVIRITNDADGIANGVQPILSNAAEASSAVVGLASDPSIHESLTHIDTLTAEAAGVATDAHTETGLLVARTREAFKPENKFLSILKLVGGGTISAAEFYYYITH